MAYVCTICLLRRDPCSRAACRRRPRCTTQQVVLPPIQLHEIIAVSSWTRFQISGSNHAARSRHLIAVARPAMLMAFWLHESAVERQDRPVLFRGVGSHWPALDTWSLDMLGASLQRGMVRVSPTPHARVISSESQYDVRAGLLSRRPAPSSWTSASLSIVCTSTAAGGRR